MTPNANYSQKIQTTASMMASLEALRQEELVLREKALREDALRGLRARCAELDPKSAPSNPNGRIAGALPAADPAVSREMGRYAALLDGMLPGRPSAAVSARGGPSAETYIV